MNGWQSARNVLCVRLDTMGDVLMTTPAMRALRESGGGRHITLLTSSYGSAIASSIPVVDDVIVYEVPWMKPEPRHSAAARAIFDDLRDRGFDAAVIFTTFTQTALPAATLCYLAGIPLRLAYEDGKTYRLLTDAPPDDDRAGIGDSTRSLQSGVRHEVRRQLDLVTHVGVRTDDESLALSVNDASRRHVRQLLEAHGVTPPTGWVLMHPGATADSRRYPPQLYHEVVQRLEAAGLTVLLTGDASERSLCDRITVGTRATSLAGDLSVQDLIALISEAPLLITNNTGPAHIAAALRTPLVALYALTNPQHTPWTDRARVLYEPVPCSFCFASMCPEGHGRCLAAIEPELVARAAIEMLWPAATVAS